MSKFQDFFQFFPRKTQPLVFSIVAGILIGDLLGDARGEINDLLHLDSASMFLLSDTESISSVSRAAFRYGFKVLSLYLCAYMIRRSSDTNLEAGQ
jgi:hypothetical protein